MIPAPRLLLVVFLAFAAVTVASSAPAGRPNIIFILADDIGYADLSCTGGKHARTPALDSLARDGIRFTNAHSPTSTCTPTRRAFLTGTYSWRQRPGSAIAPGDAPLTIPPGTTTVASLLKSAGYRTGVVGKWHLDLERAGLDLAVPIGAALGPETEMPFADHSRADRKSTRLNSSH